MSNIKVTDAGFQLRDVSVNFTAKSAAAVGRYLKQKIGHQLQERLIVMSLNSQLDVIASDTIAIGQISSIVVSPREVFQVALLNNASSIIIAHNHPSGHLTPSKDDIALTKKLREIGQLLQVPINDHFIVSTDDHYSFAENQFE
ncbi:JAB domain-containing protein [Leuconostoc gelidum subsp. gasicomitatum]|uniref:JAB domain-containing protein n=1 Tax=Leuconostoc gasicomitatum TaxID=115778 RepID=UPI001CC7C757|nr:JAB domain-containing protein [Leuconostoc gasicomitatum]MBZ5947936.1 JAB domain-containing protein [Leuconostoc gasicomitatum]